jgi:NADH-quinone oxidoreductase subunit G
VIGIGSPRASLEANYALRELVGADNFSTGIAAGELARIRLVLDVLRGPVRTPSLREIEQADAVLVLGEDVTQTAPRIALALRQAARNRARQQAAQRHVAGWQAEAIANIGQRDLSPVFVADVHATRLDDVAAATLRASPEDLARFGYAVAHAIDASAPAVEGLDADTAALARRIADSLMAADKPLVVSGTGAVSDDVIRAAANVAWALRARGKSDAAITLAVPEANSLGLALFGGQALEPALEALRDGKAEAVVVIENDLYRRADAKLVDAALGAAKTVVVADHQQTRTAEKATLLLPAASFAEGDGTLVNNEGRAQRYFQVYDPAYYDPSCQIRETWRWLHGVHCAVLAQAVSWTQFDEVTQHCANAIPVLAGIRDAAPTAAFRMRGRKLARQPHRYSGRTAMRANLSVHEPRASQDIDTALAFSMEGYSGPAEPGPLIPFAWAPGWNSPQAWNKFQDEVGGHLRNGDPGVRLIEPAAATAAYFRDVPSAFAARGGRWRAVAQHRIFGSEELSARAAPVAARMTPASAVLTPADAAKLGVAEGAALQITLDGGATVRLPVLLRNDQPAGTVGLPFGLPGIPPFDGATWVALNKGGAV